MDFLNELGQVPKVLENAVMSEDRVDVLKIMAKAAATAKTFSDFEKGISNL